MIPPYGTVFIDSDGETLMSLGVMNDTKLETLRLAWSSIGAEIEIRSLPVSLIDRAAMHGTRYVTQKEPPR